MGIADLRGFLRRHHRVALDTSVFIYQLEANDRYLPLTDAIFSWMERGGGQGIASTITMAELLVGPYRKGDEQRVDEFYALLTTFPNLEWIAPGLEIADDAARLRALHRLRTPDALIAATALHVHATGFITNDPLFDRVEGFEALILDEVLAS